MMMVMVVAVVAVTPSHNKVRLSIMTGMMMMIVKIIAVVAVDE